MHTPHRQSFSQGFRQNYRPRRAVRLPGWARSLWRWL
jgi:hypothetical protein